MTVQHKKTAYSPVVQEKLMTIKQVAVALNAPYRQLLLEVQSGKIKAYRVGKGRVMVFASEVLSSIRVNMNKEDNDVQQA